MKIKNTKAFDIMFLFLPIVLILIASGSLLWEEITNMISINWQAVEALATVGTLLIALIILVYELPKFRKEIAARKIEGLKYAREQLESEDFQRWSEVLKKAWYIGSGIDEYPKEIEGYIVYIMENLDFVAKLIELDYVDKDLLLYIFANKLNYIAVYIRNFEHKKNSGIPAIRASLPKGFALLKEAAKASSAESKESFERLDKDKTT